MKPLSEHKRINQLLRNEFVSQRTSAVKRASLKAKLSIARLTWPTENSQPTISRSRPQTIETIIGTQAHKPFESKWVGPQRITAAKRAFLQPQLRIARLIRPKENNQPTTSCSKTPKNHYWKTYATTRWFKTSLSHNLSQVSPEHVSKRSSLLRG